MNNNTYSADGMSSPIDTDFDFDVEEHIPPEFRRGGSRHAELIRYMDSDMVIRRLPKSSDPTPLETRQMARERAAREAERRADEQLAHKGKGI